MYAARGCGRVKNPHFLFLEVQEMSEKFVESFPMWFGIFIGAFVGVMITLIAVRDNDDDDDNNLTAV